MPSSLAVPLRRRLKRSVRSLANRAMAPYVAEILAGNTASAGTASPPQVTDLASGMPSLRFHNAAHELRTVELERVPKGAKQVLSIGANGRWYFDWFESSVGEVQRHVGVEAFEQRPDDLPPYVEWVVNTADHMDAVEDATIDLVFAGQTTEHLWSDELTGFLVEAHRVLAPAGLLVLDSPNRLVTEHLHWSHGGHTIELSREEIEHLLDLAGFDVESLRGVWSCREGGRRLQLEEGIEDPGQFARRAANAADRPDDSFIWFLVARRRDQPPDRQALGAAIAALFEEHWPTRITRGLFPTPGATELLIGAGSQGSVARTLPFPMHEGIWTLSLRLIRGTWHDVRAFVVRVLLPDGSAVHTLDLATASIDGQSAVWRLEQPYLLFALSLDIDVDDVATDIALQLPLELRAAPLGGDGSSA